ncbi:DUF2181 domain-containing protein [Ktedonosporobacter rubrisoli]|uniref:DUF2181 domain-containing protein n=1 Tax=Ktedonosporobacter rubrisoli TaxID=2509675 RepID=A0A4P6K4F7_KTERU|nr:DUF2181 domain-containing protein [Ktedonosporobacter rubrisoli]QBD83074.1 DUF2181 domain-containing protein [Ktedonosporobacter rubrisoli]
MKSLFSYLQKHYSVAQLGDISWAHAVNNQQRLQHFTHQAQTMMLEVDISISAEGEAIAAHPPSRTSDLTFAALLEVIKQSTQGLKLDFKDPGLLIPCLTELNKAQITQPVLLNADILQGENASASRFNALDFINTCNEIYPQGILSLGWTTSSHSSYSRENIEAMLKLCQKLSEVTFPLRAHLLPASWPEISRLTETDGFSLTIWNSKPVDQELKAWLRQHTDPKRTCYDLIDEQKNPVSLS